MCYCGSGKSAGNIVPWSTGDINKIKNMLEANEEGLIEITDYWSVGGTPRPLTLDSPVYGSPSVSLVLAALDAKTSGGTSYNAIVVTQNCLANSQYLDSASPAQNKGWETTSLRNELNNGNGSFYENLGEMKPLCKLVSNAQASSSAGALEYTNDYIWIPSVGEVFGAKSYSTTAEFEKQSQFGYYKTKANIKKAGNSPNTGIWWLRSARDATPGQHCFVRADGTAYVGPNLTAYGISPTFCI